MMESNASWSLMVDIPAPPGRSYRIDIGADMQEAIAVGARRKYAQAKFALLADTTTWRLYGARLAKLLELQGAACTKLCVDPGDASKNLHNVESLLNKMLEAGFHRHDCLICVGGGVVTDLGGFTAGCYMRGIPYISVPTTLLAQIDASVGGKTGVNISGAKNMCGMFHQPGHVYIDTEILDSLPKSEFQSGLAEVVKTALIRDREFCKYLFENAERILAKEQNVLALIIRRCCEIKAKVVEQDERESGLRRILNYGHTIGHALESWSGYRMSHGECVAYGMRAAARIAHETGRMGAEDYERHESLLDRFQLAVDPLQLDIEAILSAMQKDKKATEQGLIFVLPVGIGQVKIFTDISKKIICNAINNITTVYMSSEG
jgi:3-dehydroquinate synthase